jgi:hypothetical protein
MLVVRHIQVRSLSTDYVHVTWQIEPTTEPIANYSFYVLRSGGQAGPYDVISAALDDVYLWRDNTAREGRFWSPYFYRVRAVHKVSGDFVDYGERSPEEVARGKDPGGVSKEPEPPLEAEEMIYRYRLMLDVYPGRDVILFQSRTFGQRCPQCFDFVKGARRQSKCPNCYDTGFAGGYYTPIKVKAHSLSLPQSQFVEIDIGKGEPVTRIYGMSNFPEVKSHDVIVTSVGHRFKVSRVDPSYYQESLVSQTIYCGRVIKSDIEYDLRVQGLNPLTWHPADDRHYMGAMNLEALDEQRNRLVPTED